MKRKIVVGVILGIVLSGITVHAAPLNKAEIDKAETYLSENGIEIPEEIEFWSVKYGSEYGICPEVIQAVCWVESRCDPTAQSPDKSCKGLMQIKPSCHRERMDRLGARNVFGVWENMKTGTDYLAELREDEEDIAVALCRYNGQSAEKIEAARNGKFSGYTKKILDIASALEIVHKK